MLGCSAGLGASSIRWGMAIRDTPAPRPTTASQTVHSTPIFDVIEDQVRLSREAEPVTRAYLRHPGAVGIIAVDEEDRVLLVRQYRHPVGHQLWEVPAGLLDTDGETPLETAQRELLEEADLRAQRWTPLLEHLPSPGSTDEAVRLFLAEGLSEVPADQRHTREHEEAEMVARWLPLKELLQLVTTGAVRNANTVIGALALDRLRRHHPVTARH